MTGDTLVRVLIWISPLWHGTSLARAAAFGGMAWPAVVEHVVYLVVLFAVGVWLACWRFRVRLIQ